MMSCIPWLVCLASCAVGQSSAAPLASFELKQPEDVARWQGRHDLSAVTATERGMLLEIGGSDPYLTSPPKDFPRDVPLQVELRLQSTEGGMAQIFFFERGPSEEASVRFPVRGGGQSVTLAVPLPPLGKNYRFRFDPPGGRGTCLVERFAVSARPKLEWPSWNAPERTTPRDSDVELTVGQFTLRHTADRWGSFALLWRGQPVATGHDRPQIGYLHDGQPQWLDIRQRAKVTARREGERLLVSAEATDDQRGVWKFEQAFSRGKADTIDVVTTVSTSVERHVVFLPTLVVLPGFGTHGPRKNQGLFAGCEYLQDEPSSSTADIEGPGALRKVPWADKLTFPLMVVQHDKHFVGLTWRVDSDAAALFDSPDQSLASGAHALALIAPGSASGEREDGALLAHVPRTLRPAAPLTHHATILVGDGQTVVPAVQKYVALRGLPEPPQMPSLPMYVEHTARAWLDTEIREGDRFRHAVGFGLQPALDAAWMLLWLADHSSDPQLAMKLRDVSRQAAQAVPRGHEYHSHVGHLKSPAAGAVFGPMESLLAQAKASAANQRGAFDADGIVRYRPPAPGTGPDYSRTQPSREASGLAAQPVAQMLEAAVFAGDRKLIAEALERLKSLDHFDHQVPRGAQTWEIPLHTPDILASASIVRAYVLGYELTGDRRWLERAIEWAWTGVPFVYLHRPVEGAVGPYATIAVYGATHWKAPVWIGLPVQWCGIVYADALRRLARHDASGPWKTLAIGIAASAVQQVYPPEHPRRGLLPDSFSLLAQARNPADINPGTLQPLAQWAFTDIPAWDVFVLRDAGLIAHAAGRIDKISEERGRAVIEATPWRKGTSTVVVHGLSNVPTVKLDAQPLSLDGRVHKYLAESGTMIVELSDARKVRLAIEWNDAKEPR